MALVDIGGHWWKLVDIGGWQKNSKFDDSPVEKIFLGGTSLQN
jgi:hypothetical protein